MSEQDFEKESWGDESFHLGPETGQMVPEVAAEMSETFQQPMNRPDSDWGGFELVMTDNILRSCAVFDKLGQPMPLKSESHRRQAEQAAATWFQARKARAEGNKILFLGNPVLISDPKVTAQMNDLTSSKYTVYGVYRGKGPLKEGEVLTERLAVHECGVAMIKDPEIIHSLGERGFRFVIIHTGKKYINDATSTRTKRQLTVDVASRSKAYEDNRSIYSAVENSPYLLGRVNMNCQAFNDFFLEFGDGIEEQVAASAKKDEEVSDLLQDELEEGGTSSEPTTSDVTPEADPILEADPVVEGDGGFEEI
jgi:hypothetical protein